MTKKHIGSLHITQDETGKVYYMCGIFVHKNERTHPCSEVILDAVLKLNDKYGAIQVDNDEGDK